MMLAPGLPVAARWVRLALIHAAALSACADPLVADPPVASQVAATSAAGPPGPVWPEPFERDAAIQYLQSG